MNWDTSKPRFNKEPPALHLKLLLQKENDAIRLTKAIPEYHIHNYIILPYKILIDDLNVVLKNNPFYIIYYV